jgi:hypothetical protein
MSDVRDEVLKWTWSVLRCDDVVGGDAVVWWLRCVVLHRVHVGHTDDRVGRYDKHTTLACRS